MSRCKALTVIATFLLCFGTTGTLLAEETAEPLPSAVQGNMDALWTVLAAILVFFMQAGFAMVESPASREPRTPATS